MENRRGPKADPCGTPNKTVLKPGCFSFEGNLLEAAAEEGANQTNGVR